MRDRYRVFSNWIQTDIAPLYGYAFTPYQGSHEHPFRVIAHQESQTPLTNQRSFYKQISQSTHEAWLYTDNVNGYLQTVQKQTGNRLGAIENLLSASGQTLIFDPEHPPAARVQAWTNAVSAVLASRDLTSFIGDKTPETLAREATLYALAHLSEREAAFKQQALIETAVTHALGHIRLSDVTSAIHELQQSGKLLEGENSYWTTREAVQLEGDILRLGKTSKGLLTPLADAASIEKTLSASTLTAGQQDAVRLIAGSSDGLILVQGHAGTGKTTMLEVVKTLRENVLTMLGTTNTVVKQHGGVLHGLAPSHTAVNELRGRGITAQTLESFLIEVGRHSRDGMTLDCRNKVLVLDEASMVSNRKLHMLLEFAVTHKTKLVVLGDVHQLASPESGKPFVLLQKAGVPIAIMDDIVRQKNPLLLNAVKATYQKTFETTMALMETHKNVIDSEHVFAPTVKSPLGIVVVKNKDERIEALAADYLARTPERRANTLVIAPANEDRVKVNTLIREGLRREGSLEGEGIRTPILEPCNFTAVERTRASNYDRNDVLRFNQSVPGLGIPKSSYVTVTEIDKTHNILIVTNALNQQIALQPERMGDRSGGFEVYKEVARDICKGDVFRLTRNDKERGLSAGTMVKALTVNEQGLLTVGLSEGGTAVLDLRKRADQHIEHGYALTTYAVQGKTKPEIIYHQESHRKLLASQKDLLVAITRAEYTVTLYTDDKEKLLERVQGNPGDKTSALEALGHRFNEISKGSSHSSSQTRRTTERFYPQYDVKSILHQLQAKTEKITIQLLGQPQKVSSTEYRYGSGKGSLVMTLSGKKRGYWHDFQTLKGGNLLTLIAETQGHHPQFEFVKTLQFAVELIGVSPTYEGKKPLLKSGPENLANKLPNGSAWSEHQLKQIKRAQTLAKESQPINGTLAERYLREHRGITCALPDSLRFHPGVYVHALRQRFPALVALAHDEAGKVQSLQLIYLDKEQGTKAHIDVNKRTIGPLKGASVMLQEGCGKEGAKTLIAEGIETGLSLKMVAPDVTIKATLGIANFLHLPTVQLSEKVVFCLDNDGEKSASQATAYKAMERLKSAGKTVFYNEPARSKTDYNDVLRHQGAGAIIAALDRSRRYENSGDGAATHQYGQETLQALKNTIRVSQQQPQKETSLLNGLPSSRRQMPERNHEIER